MSTPYAPGLGVSCPQCGQVHLRCLGHRESKADGHVFPCGRTNSDGNQACYTHGGPRSSKARQHARRAAIKPRSKALSTAIATLNQLGIPMETDPLEALIGQLSESAGIVAIFRERLQALRIPKAGEGGGLDAIFGPDHTGDLAPHILLALYNEERERFAKLAKLALDAGVQERQVRVIEQQATLFADLMRKVLDDPTLGLSEIQRQTGRRIAASHLRLVGSS
jgi:hypothetical protein